MKLVHRISEGYIMHPGLNILETGDWVLYVPLWSKHQTRYNIIWMEDQTGDWRLNLFLRRCRKVWCLELCWTAPEREVNQ